MGIDRIRGKMENTRLLTTGEIADYCQVTHRAVLKWITAGKLKAYRTPGRHSRVNKEDLLAFIKNYNMPIPGDLEKMFNRKKKILVVDDDRTTVNLISGLLTEENYTIMTAYDGFTAGIKFAEFKPDLITLDLHMPMLDGFEVCSCIRGNPKNNDVKIIVVSAYLDKKAIHRITELGANGYLTKPFTGQDLKEKIVELLCTKEELARV